MNDLPTRIADALAYEDFAMRSPTKMVIPIGGYADRAKRIKHRPFYSKGWKGCHFNCGHAADDWSLKLVERVTVKDGVVKVGRYCK